MSDRTWDLSSTTMPISTYSIRLVLIPLPVVALLAAFATDVAYWLTRDPLWPQVSLWMVAAGLVTGPTAGAVGLIDFLTVDGARPAIAGWVHIMGMGTVLLVSLASFFLRSAGPAEAILPWGLILSAVTTVLLAVGAWYGGLLAYRRALSAVRAGGE